MGLGGVWCIAISSFMLLLAKVDLLGRAAGWWLGQECFGESCGDEGRNGELQGSESVASVPLSLPQLRSLTRLLLKQVSSA